MRAGRLDGPSLLRLPSRRRPRGGTSARFPWSRSTDFSAAPRPSGPTPGSENTCAGSFGEPGISRGEISSPRRSVSHTTVAQALRRAQLRRCSQGLPWLGAAQEDARFPIRTRLLWSRLLSAVAVFAMIFLAALAGAITRGGALTRRTRGAYLNSSIKPKQGTSGAGRIENFRSVRERAGEGRYVGRERGICAGEPISTSFN